MKRPIIFWDVDTQHDFMDPDGKLYVPGAQDIKPKLKRLTDYAHERDFHIVASSDDHVPGHKELSATPDFRETFPEHCMRGTPGAQLIPETTLDAPLIIEPDPIPHQELARTLWSHSGDVLLRKHWFDVFTNPNTETVLETWDPTEIVIYGVALDVCDRYAIDGFLERGIPKIHLVLDATAAIHPEDTDKLLADWKAQDVNIVSTEDVLSGTVV
ncbi:MAG TPA: isochorismatase family protein [Gemmatimonadaceae bacterium]|nr:isochorismatase family protein [Gemmatimonadaceae bacterium]